MSNIILLKVIYERIIGTNEITLTDNNYEEYGYLKDENGYYKFDVDDETKIYDTTVSVDITKEYSHILPNPTSLKKTYSDVDKEGSGRNSSDGMMSRERIGNYCSIDLTWDIIPNTIERINLIRILRSLPPKITLEYNDSDNNYETKTMQEMYRSDISEDLYMFTKDKQIWQGLSTSFVQWNVESYDDSIEPTLLSEV